MLSPNLHRCKFYQFAKVLLFTILVSQTGIGQSHDFTKIMEYALKASDSTLVFLDELKSQVDFDNPNDPALEFLLVESQYYYTLTLRDKAKDVLTTAKKHYKASKNERLRMCYELVDIRSRNVILKDFKPELIAARAKAKRLNYPKQLVMVDIFLFRIFRDMALRDSMEYYLKEAIDVASENNLIQEKAWTLRIKGTRLIRLGRFDEALMYYDKAECIYANTNNKFRVAGVLYFKGNLAFKREKYEEALSCYQSALDIYILHDSEYKIGLLNYHIGKILQTLGKHQDALAKFEKVKKEISVDVHPVFVARLNTQIGYSFLATGRLKEAEQYLKESIATKEKFHDNATLSKSYHILGEIYLKTNQLDLAEKKFEKVINISTRRRNNQHMAKAYFGLTQIALQKGELAKAEEYGEISIAQSEKRGSVETKFFALLNLAKISTQQKKYRKATEYYDAYVNLKDSVLNKRRALNIASIIEENKSKKRDLEILNLNYENEKNEFVIKQNKLQIRLYLLILSFAIIAALFFAYSYKQNKKASIKQRALNSSLNESNKKLLESNHQLEHFAHIASHDMKSPIRTITSFSNLLQKKVASKLSESELEYFGFIIRSGKNLSVMIDDILAYAKLGAQQLTLEETNLESVIKEDVIAILNSQALAKGITIEKLAIFPTFNADKVKLTRVFQNIISNAIKFSDPTKEHKHIRIGFKELSNSYKFYISDNGIGIPEITKNLFQPFTYLNSQEKYKGTGMGLTVCNSIVKKHGGKIWYESTEGAGTTFYFTIDK